MLKHLPKCWEILWAPFQPAYWPVPLERASCASFSKWFQNICISFDLFLKNLQFNEICFFFCSKIFGRFYCYTIVGFPGFLGALSIFTVPNKIAIMFTHSALVMVSRELIENIRNVKEKNVVVFFQWLVHWNIDQATW